MLCRVNLYMDGSNMSKECAASVFSVEALPEEESSRFLRKRKNYLQTYTASRWKGQLLLSLYLLCDPCKLQQLVILLIWTRCTQSSSMSFVPLVIDQFVLRRSFHKIKYTLPVWSIRIKQLGLTLHVMEVRGSNISTVSSYSDRKCSWFPSPFRQMPW